MPAGHAAAAAAADDRLSALAGWPIPLLLVAAVLSSGVQQAAYPSLPLLVALNLVFVGGCGLVACGVFARAFLSEPAPGPLLLAGACFAWGLAGLVGTVLPLASVGLDFNTRVTLYNLSAWSAAVLFLAGALAGGGRLPGPRRVWLAGFLAAIGASWLLVWYAGLSGWLPVFFVPGQGGTQVRQFVLGSTVALFVLAALAWLRAREEARARRWLGYSNLLLALGFGSVMFLTVPDSALNWIARGAQYLGSIYLLLALRRTQQPVAGLAGAGQPDDWWLRYGLALVSVGLAAGLRFVFLSEIGDRYPFLTFFPAVVVAALYGGFGPGALATLLSGVLTYVLWLAPDTSSGIEADLLAETVFLLGGLLLSALAHKLRQARLRVRAAETAERELLERRVRERTAQLEREIAERRRAEAGLQEAALRVRRSEAHLRSVLDNLQAFVGVLTPDGTLIEANRAPLEAAALARADVVGRKFWDCYWWNYAEAVQAKLRRAVADAARGRVSRYDVQVRAAGGAYLWIDFQIAPLPADDGSIAYLIASAVEITARREAEAALRESEERFRSTFESAAIGLAHVGLDGRWLRVNEVLCRMTGYSRAELQARTFGDITHADDLERDWALAQQLLDGTRATYSLEKRYLRQDGAIVWAEITVALLRDANGAPAYFIVAAADVTERRAVQQRLAESEERFRQVFENAGTGIAITDREGRFQECNPAYLAMLGYSQEELATFTYERLVHPDDLPANRAEIERLQQGRIPSFAIENRYLRKDGRVVWVSKFVSLMRDPAGEPAHLVALVTDITASRQMMQQLREADRRKDEFMATLAHELRNPLAPLRNALQILRLSPADAAARERAQGMMERQLGQLVRLVDDLLDLSRIATGKLTLKRETLDLRHIVSAAAESVEGLMRSREHDLRLDLPADALIVEGDPARLAQVVGNLLVNAAKYTPPGGRIVAAAAVEAGRVVLRVRDDGMGIAADDLPRVFDLFAQVHDARAVAADGLGIGLNLVKRLVELHGGEVEARSDGPGRGSEFVVRLPPAAAPPAAAQARQPAAVAARPRLRVLVVDDNADAADSLALLLEVMGHEVHKAYDGAAAVAAARTLDPELVFLDLGMPQLDGFETARMLRAAFAERPCIVALSGWGQAEDRRRSRAAGFDHHLTKPASPEDLLRVIDDCARRNTGAVLG